MSIYSSVPCPKCRKGELSLATAFSWNKIRWYCDQCDNDFEMEVSIEEEDLLEQIIKRIRANDDK